MKKIFIAFMALFVGCVSESDACRAVENLGFSRCSIKNSHYIAAEWYGCHHDDHVAFEVVASNSINHQVNLVVCCSNGPFGSCTLRSQ